MKLSALHSWRLLDLSSFPGGIESWSSSPSEEEADPLPWVARRRRWSAFLFPLEEPEQEYDLFVIYKLPTGIITASQQAASS
jgi:hypothetical protein